MRDDGLLILEKSRLVQVRVFRDMEPSLFMQRGTALNSTYRVPALPKFQGA